MSLFWKNLFFHIWTLQATLRTKRAFNIKFKKKLISFKGFSAARICLRSKNGPLNKTLFFDELIKPLDTAVNSFRNVLLIRDFNINILSNSQETSKHLKEFSHTFSITSLINTAVCTKSTRGSAIGIMLTNRPNFFRNTSTVTTGLSDCHKLIFSSVDTLWLSVYQQRKLFIRTISILVKEIVFVTWIMKW